MNHYNNNNTQGLTTVLLAVSLVYETKLKILCIKVLFQVIQQTYELYSNFKWLKNLWLKVLLILFDNKNGKYVSNINK